MPLLFTSVLLVGITCNLLSGLLFALTKDMPKVQRGISWWALSSIASAVGYGALFICGHFGDTNQGEAIYNLSLISWSSFLYIGCCLALRQAVNKPLIIMINVASTIWVIYFSFITPLFLPASIVTAVTVGGLLLSTAWKYLKNKRTKSRLDWFLIATLFINGLHALDYPILRPIEPIAMIALILCIVAALVINSVLASMVIIRFKSRMFSSELNALRKARHDPLTDLNNRLGLSEEFEKKTKTLATMKDRMVLVYADLDDFKHINDTYGHKDGDQVLCTIASRIKNDIHHQDIAVRMGGDEFVILLSGKEAGKDALSPGQIKQFIKRMTANICKPICINESTHQVGVSCGVAIYPNDGEDLQSLLDAADNSMYRSKKSKKKLDQANDSIISPVGLVTS